ncbi:MAG TPA: hypothetical protein VJJ76_01720 [archaeon]|nr:hypothetical protein [archaeon]
MVIQKIRKAHRHVAHHISRLKKYSYHRSRHLTQMQRTINYWRQFEWKHRNLMWLLISIIIAYIIIQVPGITERIEKIGDFGYVGSFIAGLLFTYALTTAPATAAIFVLGKTLQTPFIIAVIGATGAVISDYLIFRFVRDRLLNELKTTGEEILGRGIHFSVNPNGLAAKVIPILAGLIIASPLPDELGAALLGAAKIRTRVFIQYAFIFNLIGIFIIASLGAASV